MSPQVIILNGVGSVGKSSASRALQAISAAPYLHVAMDAFIDMLPERLIGHPDGLVFETSDDRGMPSTVVRVGPVLKQAMSGMRHAIVAMATQGNNLIIDEVFLGQEKEREYRTLLSHFDLRLVGLFAPLDILEARERMRGNRVPGLARWQFPRVHRGVTYDLEIDASTATPAEIAQTIRDAFGL